MKNKHFLLLILIGFLFAIAGSIIKIYHIDLGFISGNNLLAIGMGIEFVTILLFIIKLLKNNSGDWLNK
jgi:hypothetical protein